MDFLHTDKIIRLPVYLYRYGKRTKRTLIDLDLGIYWFWVALRIGLTLLPQTGYIHPDEYFQSVEVFAGNVFETEVSPPWEFNATFPLRSIPLIYTSVHLPFAFLRRINELLNHYAGFTIITHYTMLVIPRLSMCMLSFVSDICLFKICYHFCQNYKERLIIYASSFVCLVFMTRTFSNTIEITCFSTLLSLVASCMAESEKVIYQKDFLKEKYKEATSIPEQVRVSKLMKLLPRHSLKRCIPMALVTVSGVFNRPTFILYAVTPLFYWFQRGLTVQSTFLKDFHIRMFIFVLHCLPIVCIFIYLDSAYYGYITWGEIINLKVDMSNFVVTPLNFLIYNLDSSNLSKHGLHPRFLHFLVNIPLLFNVLGLSGLIVILKLFYRSSFSNWTLLPKSQSITGMMTLSFMVPVASLSIFPHQEPRFITPIILPLVFLYSHLIRDFEEHSKTVMPFRKRHPRRRDATGVFKYPLKCIGFFERVTENIDNRYNINGRYLTSLRGQEVVEATKSAKKPESFRSRDDDRPEDEVKEEKQEEEGKRHGVKRDLIKCWFLLNCACILFFGFLHQGGVYHLTRDFHQKLAVKSKYTTYHLITSHVYSLPVHLLSVKRHWKYKNTNFAIYEMGSDQMENINLKLVTVLRLAESRRKSLRRNYKVFYAFPTSLLNEFRKSQQHYALNYTYKIQEVFYPHLSTEALPSLWLNVTDDGNFRSTKFTAIFNLFDCVPIKYLFEFLQQFGLVLLEINLPEVGS